MTVPSSIAITKATATRASVAPRLKISAPAARFVDDRERNGLRVRQQARPRELRADGPGDDENPQGDQPRGHIILPIIGR